MTDRDTFAAAALTGLLAAPTDKDRSMDYWARLAYEAADAMLRERERWKEKDASFSYSTTSPPVSSGGPINRSAESQSPDVSVGGGEPPGVPQPDNGLATGGRGHFLTDEEREAIEMAASACDVEKQLNAACGGRQSFAGLWSDRAATLRKLLERLQ
jgi:hypothetical protein